MPVDKRNLLADLPGDRAAEAFETLLQRPAVERLKLERIVSHGQVTPPGAWYDQDQDEWVLLLSGAARLVIEGQPEVALLPGDALLLPARCRHRVSWTDPDQATVWLALHMTAAADEGA